MSKNKLALLLFLGFIVTLIYACNDYPQQKRLPTSAKSEPYCTNKTAKDRIVTPVLPVASIKKDIPSYVGYKTDLFRPLFIQPPVPKKPKRSPKPRKIRPLPPPPEAVEPVKLLKPLVSRKLASFTYLGQVIEGEKRSIF